MAHPGVGFSASENLGTAATQNQNEFVGAGGGNWLFASAGGTHAHTLAITPNGLRAAWGSNQQGQLGYGAFSPRGNGPVPGFTARWP